MCKYHGGFLKKFLLTFIVLPCMPQPLLFALSGNKLAKLRHKKCFSTLFFRVTQTHPFVDVWHSKGGCRSPPFGCFMGVKDAARGKVLLCKTHPCIGF